MTPRRTLDETRDYCDPRPWPRPHIPPATVRAEQVRREDSGLPWLRAGGWREPFRNVVVVARDGREVAS